MTEKKRVRIRCADPSDYPCAEILLGRLVMVDNEQDYSVGHEAALWLIGAINHLAESRGWILFFLDHPRMVRCGGMLYFGGHQA